MATDEQSAFDRYRQAVDRPLSRLFREYGLDWMHWFGIGMVANLLARGASLVPPLVLGVAIDAVFSREAARYALPLVPQAWVPTTSTGQFWFSVSLIAGAFLATAVFTWVYGVAANLFAHSVMHAVRTDAFEKIQRLDMSFYDDKQTGEVMSVLNNDAQNLERFLDNALMNSVRLLVMVLGIAAVLFYLNWQLALVTLVAIPAIGVLTWWFMSAVAPLYERQRDAVGKLNTRLENAISGVVLTKTTDSEAYEADRVRSASRRLFDDTMAVLKLNYLYRPGMELLAGLSFAVTFLVGGLWLFSGPPGPFTGSLSVGEFVVFIFMTQRFVTPLAEVSNIVDQYENAKASSERVFGLYDIPVRITEPDAPTRFDGVDGAVAYDDVSFSYAATSEGAVGADATDAPALADGGVDRASDDESVIEAVSFEAAPGETVALVGPTGAGKSTLMKLLLRLYDVTEGSIRVDGTDVRELALADLRSSVGYVAQDGFMFDGTVIENIRYGDFEADREAVVAAAKAAEAHEFITNLPDGYDTQIGERGVKLSGGQRQRIAVARVVLQDPDVLVLDEATSAVDTETEMLIQRSLDQLAADRTAFVIAHRLSTVKDADRILVLDDGRIVERGSHDELIAEDGLYATLWGVQAGDLDGLPEELVERANEFDPDTGAGIGDAAGVGDD